MSYRRGPNCLPTGDVEPRAEDLFLRGWDREEDRRVGFSGKQNHDALCQHRFSRERNGSPSRREAGRVSVLSSPGDASGPISRKSLFFPVTEEQWRSWFPTLKSSSIGKLGKLALVDLVHGKTDRTSSYSSSSSISFYLSLSHLSLFLCPLIYSPYPII